MSSFLEASSASTIKSVLFNVQQVYILTDYRNINEKPGYGFEDYIWNCETFVFLFQELHVL